MVWKTDRGQCSMVMKSLSANLVLLRKSRGLRQQDVAESLHLTKQTYAAYEQGRAEPDCETLVHLSKLYGLSLDSLFGEEDRNNVVISNEQFERLLKASRSLDDIGQTLREALSGLSSGNNSIEINGDNNSVSINSPGGKGEKG